MEKKLAARLAEYDSVPTYSDLAIVESQLAEAVGSEPESALDLHSAMEHYIRSAGKLSAQLESAEQRIEQAKILEAGYEAKLNALRETQWESGHDRGAKMVEFARREADTIPGRLRRLKARVVGNGSVVRQAAQLVKSAGLSPADMMDSAMEHLARKGLNPKVVFDLGAAKGYWTERFAWRWKGAEFFMIDPLAESEARLKMLCEREGRFHYLLTALGRDPAVVTMNVTPDLDGSSLMTFPNPNPQRQRQIGVKRIDDLIEDGSLKAPDLVKLDVQGFEMKVLEGGQRMFETAEVFIIEVNIFRFMENCPRVDEIVRYMSDRKFVVFDVAGMLRRPFENDLGQLDLVFVSERSPLIASNRWF
jgi:FkbM family methyltransferase